MQLNTVADILASCYIKMENIVMGKKEKLIEKLRLSPKTFTYTEVVSLLGYLGYQEDNKGRTSGSRGVFRRTETGAKIDLHRPHPQKELKEYQAKDILAHLEGEGLI